MEKRMFKAIIRVVESIDFKEPNDYLLLNKREVIREPLIEAKDKAEVKDILLKKYPQFFQNKKVYQRETKKDKVQFFYVVIFPLVHHELNSIKEGEWKCDYCGHVYENKYISPPLVRTQFKGKVFCSSEYENGNNIVYEPNCSQRWYEEVFCKDNYIPDNLTYIKTTSLNYIYKITEKSSGKCYIGKTRNNPFFRWYSHIVNNNTIFGLYLKNTKLTDWTFEIIEELPSKLIDKEVFKIEEKYITQFNSIENGFNTRLGNKNYIKQS